MNEVARRLMVRADAPPPVTVIIPARDEDPALLERAVASVASQDYGGAIEVIVVDGSDTSSMSDPVRQRYPHVRIIPNPEQTIPHALNHALRLASHSIIVRCDARSRLPVGYLARAVEVLGTTGAANVGGRMNPVGTTPFERAVALAMVGMLGSGGARYRVGGPEGAVDTVYLGVFCRDALKAVGGFDPLLPCNEDYDINWRLREKGLTVWFDPSLAVDYRPRGSLGALARQYFRYGFWKRVMLSRHPASWRFRQVAPPLVVLGLAVSALLAVAGWVGGAIGTGGEGRALVTSATFVPGAYLLLVSGGSAWLGLRRRDRHAVLLPLVLSTMHLSWGVGFAVSWLTRYEPGRSGYG